MNSQFFNNKMKKGDKKMLWDPYAKFEKKVLSNGLAIYACPMDRSFVEIGFLVHSGAREDPTGKDGVAHFVEHCCSMNAPNITKGGIEKFFHSVGGRFNLGETSYLSTRYLCACPARKKHIAAALDIFGQMLVNGKLTKNIESERKIIIQEYYKTYPYDINADIDLLLNKTTFPGHPREKYLRPLGKINTIKELSRKDLQDFYDQHYVPANISVIAAGGIVPQDFFSLVGKSPFGKNRAGKRNPVKKAEESVSLPLSSRFDISIDLLFQAKEKVNRATYLSRVAIPGMINSASLTIFSKMMKEILNEELREKRQWCYSLGADFEQLQDIYVFSIDSMLTTKCLPELEKTVEECIASVPKKEKLFHEMKNFLIRKIETMDLDCRGIVLDSLGELGTYGRIFSLREIMRQRKAVIFDDIKKISNLMRPEKRLTVIFYP